MNKFLIIALVLIAVIIGVYFGYTFFYAPKIVSESSEIVLSCSDSDGYDIFVKGGVNFERDEPGESSIYNSPDFCESHPKYGTVLREGICEGNIYKEIRLVCGMGSTCIDGACTK